MDATMSLDDVRLFLAVARHLSFAEAARRSSVPTSTVSRRIAALEETLGTRLLQRTSRSVALTQEGARLAERTAPLFEALEGAIEGARAGDEPAGRLRVTAPVVTGSERIAPALFAFAARHPRVELDLRLTNAIVDLLEERVDLAFRAGPIQDQRLVARRLWSSTYGLAASPSFVRRVLGGRREVRRAKLPEIPAIVTRASPWRLIRRGGGVEEVVPRAHVSVDDPRVAVDAAVEGLGLLCGPHDLLARAGRRLVPITIEGHDLAPRELFAVYPSRQLLPARVRLAIDWVVRTARPQAPVRDPG